MCGICGKFSKDAGGVSEGLLARMCHVMHYRGPDDEGTWTGFKPGVGGVGLGHRRLSIIDLSEAGRQPISNEDGTIHLVFNGEIYNFVYLREALEKKGHRFISKTDSEVILHLYEEEGPDCAEKLNGMFAFCIWDDNENRLLLCRDRLGIKPLVYYWDGTSLVFASEIKAILADPQVKKEVDWTALGLYLKSSYIPAPWTIFKNMKKLKPGHYLLAGQDGIRLEKFWDITPSPEHGDKTDSFAYQKRRLYNLVSNSVERRLVSDVPLGAFLSGGIDSSIVVGLMARKMDRPVKTFSIGYKDLPLYDETEYAREVADFNGSEHHEFKLSYEDVLETFPTVLDNLDEPFSDSSVIPTYIVSRETKQGVTVALAGDGADELFAGYRKYAGEYWIRYYSLVPLAIRDKAIKPAFSFLPDSRDNLLSEYARRAKKFINGAHGSLHERACAWREIFSDDIIRMILRPEILKRVSIERSTNIVADRLQKFGSDSLNKLLYLDVKDSLPDDMLNKVDRMSMRNSLEVRVPFLDHEVVEFAFQIKGKWKLHRGKTKYILLETFKSILPPMIHSRPKWGFEIPISVWLKKELRFLIDEYLSEEFIKKQQIFDYDMINRLVANHLQGKKDTSWQIWNLIVFGYWYRSYFIR